MEVFGDEGREGESEAGDAVEKSGDFDQRVSSDEEHVIGVFSAKEWEEDGIHEPEDEFGNEGEVFVSAQFGEIFGFSDRDELFGIPDDGFFAAPEEHSGGFPEEEAFS